MAKITIGTIPEVDFNQYENYLKFPHLYQSVNDDFTTPGLTLSDAISVSVTSSFNQYPTLQMTYPSDGIHATKLEENKWIMEDADAIFTHQLFKITHVTQELDQIVVEANHIAATLNDATVSGEIQFQNASATDTFNQVLNTMQPQKAFTFNSNVNKVSAVNIEKGQQAGSILINPDQEGDNPTNSIIGLYGGELQFDNFDIYHSEHAGRDTHIVISYGKNIEQFNHDVNTENMWTGAVFTVSYQPAQAVATNDNVNWSSWDSDYSSVGTYTAGGSVEIFDSPVEGHHAIRTITNGMQLALGKAVHDGDMSPDGKFQINTVNGDDWYPVAGGGWVDARWINFDTSGSYMVNNISGNVTVQADNPYQEGGAGSRVSTSGTAVVAYKPGGSIHVYYSPEIGSDHTTTGRTLKNGTTVHYDMVERNQKGDIWYRIGNHEWLYGPHLSITQQGAYRSYTNTGNGYIKEGKTLYHWDTKKKQMVPTTKKTTVAASKSKKKSSKFKSKIKTEKVKAKKGRTIIDKTITQGGKTYMHTSHGWVESGAIDYTVNGSVKPRTWGQTIDQQIKDHSKVEIYKTPNSQDALNWSIPNGASSAKGDFTITGHQATGGDGKTYVEVTYKGKTGWLIEDNINSDLSNISAGDDDSGDDSNNANVDMSQKDVTVTVGPLYAEGFGIDPNVDKVNTVDLSSNFKHDDQDLSGQQSDGSFVATQADIDQLTKLGQDYLVEHRYGYPEIQDTISYQEMSGINADWTQVGLYDYVDVHVEKFNLFEKEQINTTVWDGLAHRYTSISIGKLPISWQHLLLQQAQEQTSNAIRNTTKRTQGWVNRFENMMHSEGSDRRAKENSMMEELGMIQKDVTWKDAKGKEHKLKDVFLETRQEFEDHFQSIVDDTKEIQDWISQPGDGIITASPNWQAPQQLIGKSSNNATMTWGANGFSWVDNQTQSLLGGFDSRGHLYADSIEGVKVKAMQIDALQMNGHLVSEDPNSNMKIYIGTQNPGSTLNPWKNGRVIWATSDNYSSMFSSGQIATTSGSKTTRIHPSAITVDNDGNEVLTQENFAAHAYYRIKSWVKLWVADYLTINGNRKNIWKGIDKGAYMGKLRNLPGQGKVDYSYQPGANDDWGSDESSDVEGGWIDLGDGYYMSSQAAADIAQINQQIINMQNNNNYQLPDVPTVPTDPIIPDTPIYDNDTTSATTSGMLTFTQARKKGLPTGVALGTTQLGTDGYLYVYKKYVGTGNNHWYRK